MKATTRKRIKVTPPRKGSLAERVAAFYTANPDEELTWQDLAEKFDANHWTVGFAVTKLRALGLLESVHVVRLRERGIAK